MNSQNDLSQSISPRILIVDDDRGFLEETIATLSVAALPAKDA